jgi:hypothetical protein
MAKKLSPQEATAMILRRRLQRQTPAVKNPGQEAKEDTRPDGIGSANAPDRKPQGSSR